MTEYQREPDGRLDLNRANAEQLRDIVGLDEAIALRIVEQRDAQGPFGSVADLLQLEGIEPEDLQLLRDRLYVETPLPQEVLEEAAAEAEEEARAQRKKPEEMVIHLGPPPGQAPAHPSAPTVEPLDEPEDEGPEFAVDSTAAAALGAQATGRAQPAYARERPVTDADRTAAPPRERRGFWSGLLLVLLGSILGSALTLGLASLWVRNLNMVGRAEFEALSTNVGTVQRNNEALLERVNTLDSDMAGLEANLQDTQDSVNATEGRLDAFETEMTQSLGEVEQQVSGTRADLDALEGEFEQVDQRVQDFDGFFVALRDLLQGLTPNGE